MKRKERQGRRMRVERRDGEEDVRGTSKENEGSE